MDTMRVLDTLGTVMTRTPQSILAMPGLLLKYVRPEVVTLTHFLGGITSEAGSANPTHHPNIPLDRRVTGLTQLTVTNHTPNVMLLYCPSQKVMTLNTI